MLEPTVLSFLLNMPERNQIILYGALTEVCVRKTCFDLLSRNEIKYQVTIVTDAVLSIQEREKEVGLEGMRDAGA